MVQELTDHMANARKIREENNLANEQAMKDAKLAQDALLKAQGIITEFYKSTGVVALQEKTQGVDLPEEPSTWDSSYTKVADPNNQPDGILSILKAVSADFAQMEADTRGQEIQDLANYKEQIKASDIEKAKELQEAELKDEERKRLIAKVDSITKSVEHVNGELDSIKQYAVDLEPACKDGSSTYEERKEARDEEINVLKQTQVLLKNAYRGVSSRSCTISSSSSCTSSSCS